MSVKSMVIEHERYRAVPGSSKHYFYINSDTLEQDLQWISDNNIDSIRLSQYDGYALISIDPILQLKGIRSLAIFLQGADLTRLCELKTLEQLSIGESSTAIDLSGLEKLEDLYLTYAKNIKGLNTLAGLKKVIIVKAEPPFFSEDNFSFWPDLEDFTSLSSKLPGNLSFVKTSQKLKELEINNTRTEFDASDLSFIKGSLEVLKIGNCKKIENIENVLPGLTHLRWLALTDSVTLKNTRFADALPELEVLIVLGSSYFVDGDLSDLKKRLKHVSIDDKKHYNLKMADLPQMKKSNS
jgi:hypothetical protein